MTIITVDSDLDEKMVSFLRLAEKLGLTAKTEDNKVITAAGLAEKIGVTITDDEVNAFLLKAGWPINQRP